MNLLPNNKEHFNLYYIFEEDKKAHPLPLNIAEKIFKNITAAMKNNSGPDPP